MPGLHPLQAQAQEEDEMKQVKIFNCCNTQELQNEVNEFIRKNDIQEFQFVVSEHALSQPVNGYESCWNTTVDVIGTLMYAQPSSPSPAR